MKRLAVLVAFAAMGSGCVSSDNCTATMRVTWSQFLRADGSISTSCQTASVGGIPDIQYVDVYVDGYYQTSAFCTDPFVDVPSISPGSHDVIVEGRTVISNVDYFILRDFFTVDEPGSCANQAVDAQLAEGYGTPTYNFYNAGVPLTGTDNNCASGSHLELLVTDTIANGAVAYQFASTAGAPACSGHSLPLPLAIGTYNLRWMEERASDGTVLSSDCAPQSFNVSAQTSTAVPVALDLVGPACH